MTSAVLFDFDGTLWLSEHRNKAMWAIFFDKHGVAVGDEFFQSLTGRWLRDVLVEHAGLFPGKAVDDMLADVRALCDHPDLPAAGPAPGARELIAALAEYPIGIGIVTSSRRAAVIDALEEMGVSDLIHTAVTFEDIEFGKPHPECYLSACERLGVRPGHSIAVEDSYVGVQAARSAGIWCIGVASSLAGNVLGDADLVVDALADINADMMVAKLDRLSARAGEGASAQGI